MSASRGSLRDSVLTFVPQGHEKHIKSACYNAAAFLFVLLALLVGVAVFCVLQPFLRPLLWAALCGSFLHPVKEQAAVLMRSWLEYLKDSGMPLILGTIGIPFLATDLALHSVSLQISKHWWTVLLVPSTFLIFFFLYYVTPAALLLWFWNTVLETANMMSPVMGLTLAVSNLVFGLLAPEALYMAAQPILPGVTIITWVVCVGSLFNSLGSWQMPIFIATVFFLILGAVSDAMAWAVAGRHVQSPTREVFKREKEHLEIKIKVTAHHAWTRMKPFLEYMSRPALSLIYLVHSGVVALHLRLLQSKRVAGHIPVRRFTVHVPSRMVLEKLRRLSDELEGPLPSRLAFIGAPLAFIRHRFKRGSLTERQSSLSTITEENPKEPKSELSILQTSVGDLRSPLSKAVQSTPVSGGPTTIQETPMGPKKQKPINGEEGSPGAFQAKKEEGDSYLVGVIWATILVQLYKYPWLLQLLPLPLAYYLIRKAGSRFGVWVFLKDQGMSAVKRTQRWIQTRQQSVAPSVIRWAWHSLLTGDRAVISLLEGYVDTVASVFVIIFIILGFMVAIVIATLQVYGEGMYLVGVTSNFLNSTMAGNKFFPDGFQETVIQTTNSLHTYGRDYLSHVVQSLRGDLNEMKSMELEKQVLELWDKIYEEYEGFVSMKEDYTTFQWGEISSTAQKIPISEVMNVTNMIQFMKNNVDMVQSILKSLWTVVVGNVSLAFSAFASIINVVFGGGSAILNFLINLIIFCSSLFYLLSSSGRLYKPVELAASFSLGSSSVKFGVAMRNAISGVFLVAFKVALFHGLWTWVIHELFNLRLVFIPSVLAAVLAAVPLLGTYWAAIPGVIELWAVNGCRSAALLLFAFQLLPTYFVNDTLYGSIEGGAHPYITGLAVMGGVLALGVEGAILGPVVLCTLLIAISVYRSIIKDSPNDPSVFPHRSPFHRSFSTVTENVGASSS